MTEPGGNGAPVKRGRGRPPRPRLAPEEVSAEMIREALAAAEQIEQTKQMAQRLIHAAYLRYLAAADLLGDRAGDETAPRRPAGQGRAGEDGPGLVHFMTRTSRPA